MIQHNYVPHPQVNWLILKMENMNAGQQYAEVEVMKMCMPLTAQENGIVQLVKQPGSNVQAGDILAILALDDPSKVKHALPFEGIMPQFGAPTVQGTKPAYKFKSLVSTLQHTLGGYDNQVVMNATLQNLIENLRDPSLPYSEWNQQVSALHSRLPQKLDSDLSSLISRSEQRSAPFLDN